jgi:pimeloyl-ACP methyl ester carboxylesterase
MTRLPLLIGLLLLSGPALAEAELESDSVVLLHGLGRGPWAMKLLEVRLADAGYQVHNLAYPRRADAIEEIVSEVHQKFIDCCSNGTGEVHFVTHSLGGLVLRAYLARHRPRNLGRAVMLAPPNGGSEIVDRFRGSSLFRTIFGPMAPQLGTGLDDLPARLPVPDCEVGVIAGNHWINPVGAMVLPPPHDGTVSVNRTHLAGMKDHLVVPHTHTFIMNSNQVARHVIHFLRYGRFEEDGEDERSG